MINKYYAAIGEEKLSPTPACNIPMAASAVTNSEEDEGSGVVYQLKTVKDVHTVYKGETLTAIAKNYNCSLTDIIKWNHLGTATLRPGRKLTVYSQVKVAPDSLTKNDAPSNITMLEATPAPKKKVSHAAPSKEKYMVYVVQPGDTLSSIAQNHNGVTVRQIKAMNGISSHHVLRVGSKLKVPVSS
jgi:LysM repeat protein